MKAAIWIAQVLLAAAFGMAGFMKLFRPLPELVTRINWAGDLPPALVRFIGFSELCGALGVLVPALTRIRPSLTPLAAAGLATVMLLAAGFHVVRGELGALPINIGLGTLAAFVVWGRWIKAPIAPR